jgi:hypothetical protein
VYILSGAGVFVILLVGGFSTWKFLSPLHVESLDPAGLRAEAHAIDIQIQLADIAYPEPQAETTAAIAPAKARAAAVKKLAVELGVEPAATLSATSSEPEPATLDEALDALVR